MFRVVVIAVALVITLAGAAVAQVPESASPAQTVLQQPPAVERLKEEAATKVRPGWYGGTGTLVAPPIIYSAFEGDRSYFVMPPIPSVWGEIGYRRANDVRWQVSYMFVPLLETGDPFFGPLFMSTHGWDIDRISTNRSDDPSYDLRWQVGLRTVALGFGAVPYPFAMGPHVGLRWERPVSEQTSSYGWGDIGILPSLFDGLPLANFRAELGVKWHPQAHPGLKLSVAGFYEYAGVFVVGFMTPGIKFKMEWSF